MLYTSDISYSGDILTLPIYSYSTQVLLVMDPTAYVMRYLKSCRFWRYMRVCLNSFFYKPQKKTSHAVKSGNRGGQKASFLQLI